MKLLKVIGFIFFLLFLLLVVLIFVPPKVSVSGIPSGFTEKQFYTGEVLLNYVEGPNNGVPLMLIPGQMESWQGYKLVMPELAERFHVFVVDLRGHGKSTHTKGDYSYNRCGDDLILFLEHVIKEPSIVSGLSSGAVLAVWLAANVPHYVKAIIAEDPPMFSSVWPRIGEEKYMTYLFQHLVDSIGGSEGVHLEAYYRGLGIPQDGKDDLLYIPAPFAKLMANLFEINKRIRPSHPYDPPFLPFNLRVTYKFLLEYDVDFSKATIDGRLSEGFDPQETLKKVECPMLLLHAKWFRHETWGLVGAMDDKDVQRIKSLVGDLQYVYLDSGHSIHMEKPELYLKHLKGFVDGL